MWYALFVLTGQEEKILQSLEGLLRYHKPSQSTIFVIPKRKLIERHNGELKIRLRNLLPGYILMNTDKMDEIFERVKRHPKIIRVLGNFHGGEMIYDYEIFHILKMIDENGIVDISKGAIMNGRLKIFDGPLLGYENKIIKVNKRKNRVKVRFKLSDKEVELDLAVKIYDS